MSENTPAAQPLPLREDLRGYGGYSSARTEAAADTTPVTAWLNANESPSASPADHDGHSRRYPEPQPQQLVAALAALYRVRPEQLLVGRGSDEAIDLLVRSVCRPGGDAIITTPPVFGMYAVSARTNATAVVEVPMVDDGANFRPSVPAIIAAVRERAGTADPVKLIFLASPGNPCSSVLAPSEIDQLADAVAGEAIVVVDEAYIEFSPTRSAIDLLPAHRNLAVTRTLSKAFGLAGARIGTLIADPELIAMASAIQAPYPLPVPAVELALAALSPDNLDATAQAVEAALASRAAIASAVAEYAGCERVFEGNANFVLARFSDKDTVFAALRAAGVLVRDQSHNPGLAGCLRISAGTPADTELVESVLAGLS